MLYLCSGFSYQELLTQYKKQSNYDQVHYKAVQQSDE